MLLGWTKKEMRKKSLSRNFEEYFSTNYADVVGSGAVGVVSNYLHTKMESLAQEYPNGLILEVGAGQSQHYKFVPLGYSEYIELDLRNFESENPVSTNRRITGDCTDLSQFVDSEFDRVIATCLICHLSEPEKALEEWRRVTKDNGQISIWVALEPSILLRLVQSFTTKRKVEKRGFDYYAMHYRDHIQFYPRLRVLLESVFTDDEIRKSSFPFNFLPWDLNLVQIWTITINKKAS